MRLAVFFVLLLAGCAKDVPPPAVSTLDDALAGTYFSPWTTEDHGSGVYFVSMKGMWYLKDGVATRVVEAEEEAGG